MNKELTKNNETKQSKVFSWVLQVIVVIVMGQTLWFKFTGAEESAYIFSKLNVEPWGRYAIGILELIACMFLLIPSSVLIGTALSVILMTGALFFHLTVLSNSIQGDDGLLVVLALVTLSCGFSLLYFKRFQITIIRSLTKSLI